VASAEPGYRLYDVAAGKATLEEFLREFGHRAVFEADFLNPLGRDPSWILEQVRLPPPESGDAEPAAARRRNPATGGAGIGAALRVANAIPAVAGA